MQPSAGKILLNLLLTVAVTGRLSAHSLITGDTSRLLADTILQHNKTNDSGGTGNIVLAENKTDESIESALLYGKPAGNSLAEIRSLFHFLKSARFRNTSRNKRLAYRLYFGMAKNFARMKLYPLAMQCYFHTLRVAEDTAVQPISTAGIIDGPVMPFLTPHETTALWEANTIDHDSLPDIAAAVAGIPAYLQQDSINSGVSRQQESRLISSNSIIDAFNDGKKSIHYAIVLHVKQPKPGNRKAFVHINNVGHFFITLIKYNEDSIATARSLGFYPGKEHFFAATPLNPAANGVLKDDGVHDWDEIIGKFVSHKRFERILRLISHYNNRTYHLNNNNCTDFGLTAAAIAGIIIRDTKGRWPLGRGNNPANAGQSMLEGKIINADTGNSNGLFIYTNGNGR